MANALVVYRDKPKSNSWARWMVGRTKRQNKNNLIAIVGGTGSGKTYSAMAICEIISTMTGIPFTIDHVVFSLKELMELLNSDKIKRSCSIIFDEPQISISAREFQSQANKVFNYVVSTFRHRNLNLFFCTPFETLLDKNTRKLFHARFETSSINRNNKTCRLHPRFVEYSDFKAEPYRKQMIIQFKENGITQSRKLFFWDVPLPSKELIELYEAKKLAFTSRLNKNILHKLNKMDEKGESITGEPKDELIDRKPLTARQEEVMRTLAGIKENNKQERASKILKISIPSICRHKQFAEKKGYKVEEFMEVKVKVHA